MKGGRKCRMPLPPQMPCETPALVGIIGQPVFTPVPLPLLRGALSVPLKWGTIMGPALTTGMRAEEMRATLIPILGVPGETLCVFFLIPLWQNK